MYLRRIQLRHWACHDDLEIELGPDVNVCCGPNGTGKSTAYQAILTALTVKHSARNEDLRALEPWGVEGCGPSITLEIVRPEGPWRLTKTYLHEMTCRLDRQELGDWVLSSKGKVAEAELERWLDADGTAGRLLLSLWSPQADPTQVFDTPLKAGKVAPATVLERIIEQIERTEAAGPFAILKKNVGDHYARCFTPKERWIKSGSDLKLAIQAHEEAEQHWNALADRQRGLTEKVAEYQALAAELAADCVRLETLKQEQADRDQARAEFEDRLETLRESEALAKERAETYQRHLQDHKRLLKADADLVQVEHALRDLEPRLEQARHQRLEVEEILQATESRRRTVGPRLDELGGLLERADRLSEALQRLQERREAVESLALERDAARSALARSAGCLEAARTAIDRAEAVLAGTIRAGRLADLRATEAAWSKAEAAFQAAETSARVRERVRLASTLDEIDQHLQERLDPANDGGPIPDVEDLATCKRLASELDGLARILDADALTLDFEPTAVVVARLGTDQQPASDPRTIGPGQSLSGRGATRLILDLDGIGRVTVGRAASDPAERLARLETLRQDLADQLAAYSADSTEELEARLRRSEARASLDRQLDRLLRGESLEALRSRLDRIEAALSDQGIDPETLPTTSDSPAESEDLEVLRTRRDQAGKALAAARARLEAGELDEPIPIEPIDPEEARRLVSRAVAERSAAETAHQAAAKELNARSARLEAALELRDQADRDWNDECHGDPGEPGRIRFQIAECRQGLIAMGCEPKGDTRGAARLMRERLDKEADRCREALEQAARVAEDLGNQSTALKTRLEALHQRRLEILEEVANREPPEIREAALTALKAELDLAEARVRYLREQLPPDPSADAEEFLDRLAELQKRCDEANEDLIRRRSELDVLGAEGLDSKLSLAVERLDERRRSLERLEREASALALLHHLIAEVEANQARGTAARLEALSGGFVARLTDRRLQGVMLDPKTLTPILGRTDNNGLAHAIERFSRGTREQIALACRLQIGLLLARESRHMILLDDPLAHTDPNRHREALDLLAELSDGLQVILFTCHQDRYAALWEHGRGRRIEIGSPF